MSALSPQVIKRGDEFVIHNIELDGLTIPQRIIIGIEVWEQVRSLMFANGTPPKEWRDVDVVTAEMVGASRSSLTKMRELNRKRPDLVERYGEGEFTLVETLREAGQKVKSRLDEGRPSGATRKNSYFGRGDKFDAAIEPLARYLKAWETKEFRYTHVNPREARSRLKKLNAVLVQLEKTREDLERRSHSARLSAPSEKRRGEV